MGLGNFTIASIFDESMLSSDICDPWMYFFYLKLSFILVLPYSCIYIVEGNCSCFHHVPRSTCRVLQYHQQRIWFIFALGFFVVGQYTVRKKIPNLTKTNIFSYGELSYGEKSANAPFNPYGASWSFFLKTFCCYCDTEWNHW